MISKELSEQMLHCITDMMKTPIHRETQGASRGELGMLGYLTYVQDGVSAGCLRKHFEVGSGRIADTLAALERKGLIRRETDPKDGRRVLVFRTEAGAAIARTHMEKMQQCQLELLEYLGEEDARELFCLSGRIRDFLRLKHNLQSEKGANAND